MIKLTDKIKKDILKMKASKATTGDIIRAHPGLSKKQIKDFFHAYKRELEELTFAENLSVLHVEP